MKKDKNIFVEYIKSLRMSAGLTRQEAAALICISPDTICEWELGQILPSIENSEKIATAYKISAHELREILEIEAEIQKENKKGDSNV